MKDNKLLVLASSSPRRRELLKALVARFELHSSDVDESVRGTETPVEHAERLAVEKAMKGAEGFEGFIVLAADTIVTIDGRILGKPASAAEATQMLTTLSGRTHTVITAFCLYESKSNVKRVRSVESSVKFRPLTNGEIEAYVATGEPMDKAGSYGAQGAGSHFIERIDGSFTNVVGLPLEELAKELNHLGFTVPAGLKASV